ncbi:hypothetical protein J6590_107082 [Homalodisca vitripennis]|nr:hypothetical protein J6590_107082 [Homalodisca vitripennis]
MTSCILHDSHVVLGLTPAPLVLVLLEEERISRKEKCSASLQRRLFLYFWKRRGLRGKRKYDRWSGVCRAPPGYVAVCRLFLIVHLGLQKLSSPYSVVGNI